MTHDNPYAADMLIMLVGVQFGPPGILLALGVTLARHTGAIAYVGSLAGDRIPGPVKRLIPPKASTGSTERLTLADLDKAGTPPESLGSALAGLPKRVLLRDLDLTGQGSMAIPFGLDSRGRDLWGDLAGDTYHIGLYGMTGAGKDSLLRGWFTLLCKRNDPAALQWAILDGKGDWLIDPLADLAHMFIPPAGGYGKRGDEAIKGAIARIDAEAERRQELIRRAGVTSWQAYRAKGGDMPLLIVVATDVMTSIAGDVESLLIALVSKARALGIRVVVSMQTPTGRDTRWRGNLSTVMAGSLQMGSQDSPAMGVPAGDLRYRPSALPPPAKEPGVFVARIGADQHLVRAPYLPDGDFDRLISTLPKRLTAPPTSALSGEDELLAALLASVPVQPVQGSGSPFLGDLGHDTGTAVQYGTEPVQGVETGNTGGTDGQMIRSLLAAGHSKNEVAALLGGSKSTAYKRINKALEGGV